MLEKRTKRYIRIVTTHFVLVALGLLFMLPFLWMLSTSLKPDGEMFSLPPKWIPENIRWSNYRDSLQTIPFFRYLRNTVSLTVVNLVGTVLSTSVVAYSFARLRWRGRELFLRLCWPP